MNIAAVTKHFATPSEVYTNNLSASISAGAVTVPVNANNDYVDGDIVVLTVEPGTTNEATFTGEKASTPARFINCVWTEGNLGVGHASGVTITDYDSATHFGMMSKGIRVAHNQDGTLKTSAVQAALNISAAVPSDYTSLAQAPTTILHGGQRSYTLTYPGVNYTDRLSPGMRLRSVRTTPTGNQCADFESTSSQYATRVAASVTGIVFTDDYTLEAWIKPESMTGAWQYIVGRRSAAPGFALALTNLNQLATWGNNGAAEDSVSSYQSVPVGEWSHVAATMDLSGSIVALYINGIAVPYTYSNTAAASISQAGDLRIGSNSTGTETFDGKISEVRMWNVVRTEAQIRANMGQPLTGVEAGLVGYWKLASNFNDSTANANNLTAVNGATSTSTDFPFGVQGDGTISTTVDYGIIQKSSYLAPDTTVIVQIAEGNALPTSGGIASTSYSQFLTSSLHKNKSGQFLQTTE
jgi:hypothetical protein